MFERSSNNLSNMSMQQLFRKIANDMTLLVRKEIELAKSESKEELRREVKVMTGLGICAGIAFIGMTMALTALMIGLLGWGGAAIVGCAMLLIGSGIAALFWAKRIKQPMPTTQQTLKEDAQWLKDTIKKLP